MAALRRWDRHTAPRVDDFMANSDYVAGRIKRYYGRSATVISPPVDTERFVPTDAPPHDYYLMVSALSPYKRVEVAIEAFSRMGRPLKIAGWGPERERLEALAGPTVQLLGRVDDAELLRLYQNCRGFLLPGGRGRRHCAGRGHGLRAPGACSCRRWRPGSGNRGTDGACTSATPGPTASSRLLTPPKA